jgi:ribosomal protein S3
MNTITVVSGRLSLTRTAKTMKIERAEITLSTDMAVSAIAFLLTLFVLVGFALVLRVD